MSTMFDSTKPFTTRSGHDAWIAPVFLLSGPAFTVHTERFGNYTVGLDGCSFRDRAVQRDLVNVPEGHIAQFDPSKPFRRRDGKKVTIRPQSPGPGYLVEDAGNLAPRYYVDGAGRMALHRLCDGDLVNDAALPPLPGRDGYSRTDYDEVRAVSPGGYVPSDRHGRPRDEDCSGAGPRAPGGYDPWKAPYEPTNQNAPFEAESHEARPGGGEAQTARAKVEPPTFSVDEARHRAKAWNRAVDALNVAMPDGWVVTDPTGRVIGHRDGMPDPFKAFEASVLRNVEAQSGEQVVPGPAMTHAEEHAFLDLSGTEIRPGVRLKGSEVLQIIADLKRIGIWLTYEHDHGTEAQKGGDDQAPKPPGNETTDPPLSPPPSAASGNLAESASPPEPSAHVHECLVAVYPYPATENGAKTHFGADLYSTSFGLDAMRSKFPDAVAIARVAFREGDGFAGPLLEWPQKPVAPVVSAHRATVLTDLCRRLGSMAPLDVAIAVDRGTMLVVREVLEEAGYRWVAVP